MPFTSLCFSYQVPLVDGGDSLFSKKDLLAKLPPLNAILGLSATEVDGEHTYHHGGTEYLLDDRGLIQAGHGRTCARPCTRLAMPACAMLGCARFRVARAPERLAAHRALPPLQPCVAQRSRTPC